MDGVTGECTQSRDLFAKRRQFSELSMCSWINPSEVLTQVVTLVCAFCPKGNMLLYQPCFDSLLCPKLYLVILYVWCILVLSNNYMFWMEILENTLGQGICLPKGDNFWNPVCTHGLTHLRFWLELYSLGQCIQPKGKCVIILASSLITPSVLHYILQ